MHPQSPFRVLIAETYPLIREGWIRLFNDQPDIELIGQTQSMAETIAACRRDCPDVLIVNGNLPVYELLAALHEQGSRCKVIIVSLHLGPETVHRCLQAGVCGLLSLSGPTDSILTVIRKVAQGGKHVPAEMSRYLVERIAKPSLTSREQAVLLAMAQGQSNGEIGRSLFISEGTVKSHANRIFSKLQVNDRTQAVLAALKYGWVTDTSVFE
jgi:two-component system NarL family response regulator